MAIDRCERDIYGCARIRVTAALLRTMKDFLEEALHPFQGQHSQLTQELLISPHIQQVPQLLPMPPPWVPSFQHICDEGTNKIPNYEEYKEHCVDFSSCLLFLNRLDNHKETKKNFLKSSNNVHRRLSFISKDFWCFCTSHVCNELFIL